jgi:5-methylcytosine-specific restriction endonuclease McrA
MRTPEEIKQAKRDWGQRDYAANREKYIARAKQWQKDHPERTYAKSKRYRAKYRERYNAAQKRWADNNSEKRKEIAHRSYRKYGTYHVRLRQLRQKLVTVGDLTDIEKVYHRCAELRQWFTGLVVDHIIPISKGGTHEPNNLQIIYDFENRRKNARLDYKPKVVFV